MSKLLFSVLIFSHSVWASDPVRLATDAEIESKDPKITLSMGLENVQVDGKPNDRLYDDLFKQQYDYLKCVDQTKGHVLKFEDSKLRAKFSISKIKTSNAVQVDVSFVPVQQNKKTQSCLKQGLKTLLKEGSSLSGELVFKYSRPLKYDSSIPVEVK